MISTPIRETLLRSVDATWTAADWEQLPHDDGRRYEIIGGVLYVRTAPSLRHQRIARQVVLRLHQQLDSRALGMTLWPPIGVFMSGADPVQPDILVILVADYAIIGERRIDGVPALVVEILSPSNPEHDLVTKRAAYARVGVPEYWVFRPEERDILVHSDPDPATGLYLQVARIPATGELLSPTLPFRAPVTTFFTDEADTPR
ncbi:MAG: Uma2 family endonuclease [Chloroflexia bacterium]